MKIHLAKVGTRMVTSTEKARSTKKWTTGVYNVYTTIQARKQSTAQRFEQSKMSVKDVFIVARIRNPMDILGVNSNDPKVVARYIDDNGLYDALLGVDTDDGLKTVVVGAERKKEDTHMCIMIGATVPEEHDIEYGAVAKRFDDTLCPPNTSMFWSHDATYIIIEASKSHHQHAQAKWWTETIKEMQHSYQIEIVVH